MSKKRNSKSITQGSSQSKKGRLDFSSASVTEEMTQRFGGSGFGAALDSLIIDHDVDKPNHNTQISEVNTEDEVKSSDPFEALGPKRQLRLSITRAGRGGKTVTTLQTTKTSSTESRRSLARDLGRTLGCRAWVEEDQIVIQGDQRERLKRWIEEQS